MFDDVDDWVIVVVEVPGGEGVVLLDFNGMYFKEFKFVEPNSSAPVVSLLLLALSIINVSMGLHKNQKSMLNKNKTNCRNSLFIFFLLVLFVVG